MFLRGTIVFFLLLAWGNSRGERISAIPDISMLDTLKSDTLKAVEVTKQRESIPPSITVSAQQLTRLAIENSNSLNVADALKGFSGVQIRDYGGIGGMKTIDVRSLGSKHTTVFYDGMPINDAQSGEIDLSKFSLGNLQSVSLYNNNHYDIAQPAKAFASASALFLQSRAPILAEGKKSNLQIGIQGGSFGLVNPSLLVQHKIAENTSLSLNAEWLKASGEYDFHYKNQALLDTIIRRRNTDIEKFRVEAIAQGLLADSSLWRINGYVYFSERGLPGPAVDNKYYAYDRQWDKNSFLQGHWDKKVTDFYSLKVNGKYTYNWLRYIDPYYNERFELNNFYEQQEVYFSVVNVFQLAHGLKAAVSADYFHNALDANLLQFAYPTRNTGLVNLAADYQHERLTIQGNVLTTWVNEEVRTGNTALSKTAYSPSLSASYRLFEAPLLYVRASYKSIFRMPTFNDSYYTFVGSTHLQPEYVKATNVGFTLQKSYSGSFKTFILKADAYHNDIKDKITAIPQSFRWTMVNLGKVEILGLDFTLQGAWSFADDIHLEISTNGTFQKGLDKRAGSNQFGHDIPYSPRISGSLNADFNYGAWTLSTSSQYTGSRYGSFHNSPSNYMEPWVLQDVAIAYKWRLSRSSLKLKVDINNLTDTDYFILENYPMPGRNFRLGVQVQF